MKQIRISILLVILLIGCTPSTSIPTIDVQLAVQQTLTAKPMDISSSTDNTREKEKPTSTLSPPIFTPTLINSPTLIPTFSPIPTNTPHQNKPIIIPQNGAYIGAYIDDLQAIYSDSLKQIETFESMVGRPLAIIHVYWAMQVSGRYSDFSWIHLQEHFDDNRIVMVSWSPGDYDEFTGIESPIRFQEIIDGKYDHIIEKAAKHIAVFGKPIFLRFAWEMDHYFYARNGPNAFGPEGSQSWLEADDLFKYFGDPGKPDGPERFVAAWKHVRNIFDEAWAENVIWVWSPNFVPDPRSSSTQWNNIENYYPGDDQVDWIATTTANFGYDWIGWLSFEQMFDQNLFPPSIEDFHKLHPDKPVMIAEMTCAEIGGDKAQWITDAYTKIKQDYPYIKAVLWFSKSKEREWQVDSSPESLASFKNAIADPYYIDQVLLPSN